MSEETIIVESYSHECEGEEVVKPLLNRLKDNKEVKNLYLMNVPLGEKGAIQVADMLLKNRCLETLYLNGSGLTDRGLKHLAMALETNNTLVKLSLSDNAITDDGMDVLARSLAKNTSIQELKALDNRITKLGRAWGQVSISKMNLFGNAIVNVPRTYLGQRRVSNCKMAQLKKFLKQKDDQIAGVEKRILPTTQVLPSLDDMWRLQTIGHLGEFKEWLDCLVCDHENFTLVLLGIRHDAKCTLRFMKHGYGHLVRDIFRFLFVGDEKHYDFARTQKVLRTAGSALLDGERSN